MLVQHVIYFKSGSNMLKKCIGIFKRSFFNYLTKEKTVVYKEGNKEVSI